MDKFEIASNTSKKTGKAYTALYLNGRVIAFVNPSQLRNVLFMNGITLEDTAKTTYKLEIKL